MNRIKKRILRWLLKQCHSDVNAYMVDIDGALFGFVEVKVEGELFILEHTEMGILDKSELRTKYLKTMGLT